MYRVRNVPPVCLKCGRDNQPDAFLCDQCGEPLKDSKCKDDCARAQVVATLLGSQDTVTWLAFSLAMTTESVLLVGFFDGLFDGTRLAAHLIFPLFGIFLALVFRYMVNRSNGDMGALQKRGENISFNAFNIPNILRRGKRGAGELMSSALMTWVVAWILAFVLTVLAGLAGNG